MYGAKWHSIMPENQCVFICTEVIKCCTNYMNTKKNYEYSHNSSGCSYFIIYSQRSLLQISTMYLQSTIIQLAGTAKYGKLVNCVWEKLPIATEGIQISHQLTHLSL